MHTDLKQLIAEAVHPPDSVVESSWEEIFGNGIYSILHNVCIKILECVLFHRGAVGAGVCFEKAVEKTPKLNYSWGTITIKPTILYKHYFWRLLWWQNRTRATNTILQQPTTFYQQTTFPQQAMITQSTSVAQPTALTQKQTMLQTQTATHNGHMTTTAVPYPQISTDD